MTTTNMQITTLEQAELELRRSRLITVKDGADYVEGKQLLGICGFSYSDIEEGSNRVLDRQIERHSFVNGQDFMVTSVGDGRFRRPLYYFTINAAKHVLLTAMTGEVHNTRQETIDSRQQQLQQQSLSLQNQIQALLQAVNIIAEVEQRQTEQQQALESQGERVATIEHRLNTRSLRLGYILRTDARIRYCPRLSDAMVRDLIQLKGVDNELQPTLIVGGFTSRTMIVNEEQFQDAVEEFYSEIQQVTATQYTHPDLGSKRFKT